MTDNTLTMWQTTTCSDTARGKDKALVEHLLSPTDKNDKQIKTQ